MGLELEPIQWEWYVPLYRGNRARWEAGEDPDPFMVEIRMPTYEDSLEALRMGDDKPADQRSREFFCKHTRGVKGLVLQGAPPIETGSQLMDHRDLLEPDLFGEINAVLIGRLRLDEGLRKNSKSAPGSSAPHQATDGNAAIAELVGSTS